MCLTSKVNLTKRFSKKYKRICLITRLYGILSYKQSGSALSILLYFTLKDVLTEDIPWKFNTFNE